ncbi:3-hydroxyacyl-CoA dehydrogenase family protein [Plantactinospora sp. DSM 117369]
MASAVRRVGVVGAGTMGIGVSHVFARAGLPVVLVDIRAEALSRARAEIANEARTLPMLTGAPRVPVDEVLAHISFETDLKSLGGVDFVVENVSERWEVKQPLYVRLDEVCPPGCVLGVNTSAIPITRLAGQTGRPGQVIGTHFMNPAAYKPLVEVIRGFHTQPDTVALTRSLLADIGKDSIVVADSPGFVTNRVLMLTINEAIFLLQEKVASAAEIDRLFRECFGHRMGPLETADLIGLDTVLDSLAVLVQSFEDPKYRPCVLLKQLVSAGRLGRKAGAGFFEYEGRDGNHG